MDTHAHTHTGTDKFVVGTTIISRGRVPHTDDGGGRARATMTRTKIISAGRRPVFAVWESSICARVAVAVRVRDFDRCRTARNTPYSKHSAHNTTHITRHNTVVFIVAARKTNGRHTCMCVCASRTVNTDFSISHVRFDPYTTGSRRETPGTGG